jgi:hypothetical protein
MNERAERLANRAILEPGLGYSQASGLARFLLLTFGFVLPAFLITLLFSLGAILHSLHIQVVVAFASVELFFFQLWVGSLVERPATANLLAGALYAGVCVAGTIGCALLLTALTADPEMMVISASIGLLANACAIAFAIAGRSAQRHARGQSRSATQRWIVAGLLMALGILGLSLWTVPAWHW